MRLPLQHPGVAAIIAVGFSLVPMALDTTIASLPALQRHFGASVSRAQLTLSVFAVALALSQLAYGPLSDRFGRRPTLLAGSAIFFLSSLACALAPSVEALIAARFLQGIGCCAPYVLGRAIVRDVHGAEGTARMMGYISAGMSVLICLWPLAGGQLEQWLGWRAVFGLHALMSGGMLVACALYLAESNPHRDASGTGLLRSARNYRSLLRDRRFVGYAGCSAFGYCAIMAFLSSASFVLMQRLGLAAWQFGLLFSFATLGYIVGTLATARMVPRLGIDRLLQIGTALGAAAGITMAALALAGVHSAAAIILPYFVFMIACGLNQPTAMAGAIAPYAKAAGTASALFGFVQMAGGAPVGPLLGLVHDGTPVPMGIAIALFTCGTLASYHLVVRPAQGHA